MFKELVKKILNDEARKGKINIKITNDETIKTMNKQFRGKNKPTDVLSFEMNEDGIIGDIVISKDTTRTNAKKYNVTYQQELKRLVIHGVLHLLGYDHGKEMQSAEKIYQKL
jgi:probable rRNA maturation factor